MEGRYRQQQTDTPPDDGHNEPGLPEERDTQKDHDWIRACVSTDGNTYDCRSWSGNSNGWTDQAFWLTSYAGYPAVWLAWAFTSDGSVSGDAEYAGPFIDNITVWVDDGAPLLPPEPDPAGTLIDNGDFGNGLASWQAATYAGAS